MEPLQMAVQSLSLSEKEGGGNHQPTVPGARHQETMTIYTITVDVATLPDLGHFFQDVASKHTTLFSPSSLFRPSVIIVVYLFYLF